ncbi:MAG: acyl carrier protein [Bacteroidales bacterium]|nr:acyl carrier protein [Bacteroidales bacterium]
MELAEIFKQVNEIFKDIFEEDDIVIEAETSAKDIDGWDSLTHMQMITAVEKHFKIKFELNEILNFKNAGDMCRLIQTKLG